MFLYRRNILMMQIFQRCFTKISIKNVQQAYVSKHLIFMKYFAALGGMFDSGFIRCYDLCYWFMYLQDEVISIYSGYG